MLRGAVIHAKIHTKPQCGGSQEEETISSDEGHQGGLTEAQTSEVRGYGWLWFYQADSGVVGCMAGSTHGAGKCFLNIC